MSEPKWVDLYGIDPEFDGRPIEGVVVDNEPNVDRLCAGMVETMTEFDWAPESQHSLPEHLRDGLRKWAREFYAWDRQGREGGR